MHAIHSPQRVVSNLSEITEHRTRLRFPVGMELHYKLAQGPSGSGRTVDISSGGLLFETDADLPGSDGADIELALKWPCLLNRECPLKLIVRGHIVRRDQRRIAVKIRYHEFRTAGAKADTRLRAKAALVG